MLILQLELCTVTKQVINNYLASQSVSQQIPSQDVLQRQLAAALGASQGFKALGRRAEAVVDEGHAKYCR